VTYPPVPDLQACGEGLMAILAEEGVNAVTVVGTSLGGYLAQYLVARYPDQVNRAVFANTFAPGERSARTYGRMGWLLPLLPESLVMGALRRSIEATIYPAAGHSELVRAYLLEQSYGKMSKAQLLSRRNCAVEPFTPADLQALGIPVLILEADNDPLVPEELREELKTTYPTAQVRTLHGVGHFSYLNEPETYTQILQAFLDG
jgi:maspardin